MTSPTSSQYRVCNRCNGKGEVTVRLGPPGTDTHTPAGQIQFTDMGTYTCDVCLGTGWLKPRHDDPPPMSEADQLTFGEIWDNQPTT